jgi:hypothetical protein
MASGAALVAWKQVSIAVYENNLKVQGDVKAWRLGSFGRIVEGVEGGRGTLVLEPDLLSLEPPADDGPRSEGGECKPDEKLSEDESE